MEIQLQQFLDGFLHKMASHSVARSMERKKAVNMAVHCLDLGGADFDSSTKEEILQLEEKAMVKKLSEVLPRSMCESLPSIASDLGEAVEVAALLRAAIDDSGELPAGTLGQLFLEHDSSDVCQLVLRRAITCAANKAAKVRKCHSTWRKSTEARVGRLARAEEDTDHAIRQLAQVEAQLDGFGVSTKRKGKQALLGLADKNSKVLIQSSFSDWLSWMTKARELKAIRTKFQDKLDAATKRLYTYKASKVACVKAMFTRQAQEGTAMILKIAIDAFKQEAEFQKNERQCNLDVEKAKARMANLQKDQKQSAKKVMFSMASGQDEAVLQMTMSGWIQYTGVSKKEKKAEEEMVKAEEAFKARMAGSRNEAKGVLAKIAGNTNSGLLSQCIAGWVEVIKEEKGANAQQKMINDATKKFKFMKERHSGNAQSVQERANENMKMELLQKCMIKWYNLTKCTNVDNQFTRKLETKRKQLAGVQNLFKAFAQQLEQGLNDGDTASNESSRGGTGRESIGSKKSRPLKPGGVGLTRGTEGAVSLPNIHARAA